MRYSEEGEVKMKRCVNCHGEMPQDAKFCILCGTTVSNAGQEKKEKQAKPDKKEKKADKNKQNVCSACASPLREGASFCVSCGKPVEPLPVESAKSPSALTDVSKSSEKEDDKVEKTKTVAAQAVTKKNKMMDKPQESADASSKEVSVGTTASQKISLEWTVHSDQAAARYADEIDLLKYGNGVVSRLDFPGNEESKQLLIKGKVKCHGCNKLTIFSIETHKGWGSVNEPVTCPCGKSIVIGEFWSDESNEIYLWATSGVTVKEGKDYPLSLEVIKVMNK